MTVAELDPNTLSPRAEARENLTAAIAAVDNAKELLAQAKAAAAAGLDRAIAVSNEIERLRTELPRLPATASAASVLSALCDGGDVMELERSPRAAAQAEIAGLERARDQLRRALDVAEAEVLRRKSAIGLAETRARRMAAAVLRASGAAARLLEGLPELEREVIRRRLGLAFLLRNDGVPAALVAEVGKLLDGHSLPGRSATIDHWGRNPTMTAWADALKALATDPDAGLPV